MNYKQKFSKKYGYKLIDIISGVQTLKKLKILREMDYWSYDQLYEFQFSKLKKILNHSKNNVPYYKDLFKKENININNIKDIESLNILPILKKEDLRFNEKKFISNKINLQKDNINIGTSGGTTGAPVRIYRDVNSREWIWGAYYRWYSWMKIELGAPIISIWGEPIVDEPFLTRKKRQTLFKLQNKTRLDAFDFSEKKINQIINKINNKKPKLLTGYASALYNFASKINSDSIDFKLNAISTTAEVLMPEYRDKFYKIFGVKTFDQYGCGEVNSMAFECRSHSGLHVTMERCIIEFNSRNKFDNLIVTDLNNFAMPLIRYENGDLSKYSNDNNCKCGRSSPKLERIQGRIADSILTPKGNVLHPEFFTHLISELNWYKKYQILKYQVVQTNQNLIIWNFVITPKPTNIDISKLISMTKSFLQNMDVQVNFVSDIPNENLENLGMLNPKYIRNTLNQNLTQIKL